MREKTTNSSAISYQGANDVHFCSPLGTAAIDEESAIRGYTHTHTFFSLASSFEHREHLKPPSTSLLNNSATTKRTQDFYCFRYTQVKSKLLCACLEETVSAQSLPHLASPPVQKISFYHWTGSLASWLLKMALLSTPGPWSFLVCFFFLAHFFWLVTYKTAVGTSGERI